MNIEVKKSKKPLDYTRTIKILEKRAHDVSLGLKNELLWVLEHKTVYTSGKTSKDHEVIDKSIKVIKTNRGGKITLHAPGQKIVYFVINLNKRGKDIRKLLNKIQGCIISILKEYNIKSFPDKKNIGIWVKDKTKSKKIGAIGIRVKKWIAYHGFALNVSNDLSGYGKIIPCGIKNKGVTSIKKLGVKKYKNINKIIIKNFLNSFH